MKVSTLALGSLSLALPTLAEFSNPVFWEDFADLDVIRVDDVFYYSASNMHYSPGAPLLRSYDLLNWEFIGHSIPELAFGSAYNLEGGQAIIDTCYYDVGLLISSDDTMYVAYGNDGISVAQLSEDGLSQVSTQVIFPTDDAGYLEGSRFYERNGTYYIFVVHPANEEHVLMSTSGPFGPYTRQPLITSAGNPVPNCGYPHQGGIVDTPNGDWYYMAFVDAYPGGRIPVLAPLVWGDDGWPTVELVDGTWSTTYDTPNITPSKTPISSFVAGTDNFTGTSLSPQWEWNHNPDNDHWSLDNGLILDTVTVTDDLYAARNTLSHRILGPQSSGTIHLNISSMASGDRAGLALLRDSSAWIGVVNDGGASHIGVTTELSMGTDWNTVSTGSEVATADLTGDEVWLRVDANIEPTAATGQFSYSLDGATFSNLGDAYALNTSWEFFMGYRFGIFNFASEELGGSVRVNSFELST
ncbi:glycosyl hydrolase [Aspergillus ambiguus]|uniref:putative xylosidase/glycosyl hydrolase n=1 Tax=Aspergillus ambiguus TaxID=176160 RepID=UPI003CCE2DEA